MNKRSSPDAREKQQHTLVEFKAGCDNWRCRSFYSLFESAIQLDNFEIDRKGVHTTSARSSWYICMCRSHMQLECSLARGVSPPSSDQ
jgi:hypothetical protein